MVLRSDNYYRALAENAVRQAGIDEPPVSTSLVASRLGVPVIEMPLPPWFSAALIYEDGMPAVLLNSAREPHIQVAGLGHVLGHLLVVIDDAAVGYPKAEFTNHHAADLIADELETPGYMVADQAQKWFNDYRYLARLFGVSEKRMLEKMNALGIIKNRGVMWDY
ncbi:MAG: hypothetical protein CVT66_04620 [Actinobacteria bacterium HGW-Actinobacteria-6]|nr:MAG: hypothetical protein CVT66_04620 [Actinobacteria bacterium HGW-Actinobacteria-6]